MDNVVLIADSDVERRETLVDALDQAGFSCLAVGTGSEALATVGRYAPQLAIVHTELPDVQGTDVCLRLKQEDSTESQVVILVSANPSDEERFVAAEVGADLYLEESTELDEMVNYVHEIFYREHLNAAARGLRETEDD